MWVHDLRDAGEACGGKAVSLARLLAAGVVVPPGFVIDGRAFTSIVGALLQDADPVNDIVPSERSEAPHGIGHRLARTAELLATATVPQELEREVLERAAQLGTLVAVRSSATIEDTAAGAAAGVFSSRVAVPVADVWSAIRAVWTSALTPLAAAYARRRGGDGGRTSTAIAVIIQEYVAGTPLVVYTRPPGQPSSRELLVQRHDHVSRHSRDDLPREIETQHAAVLALRAEQVLGIVSGVDVELVQMRKQSGFDVAIETVVVQARPIVHPAPRALTPVPAAVLAPLQDGRRWTWDVAHNPDPLSSAQQGLVERVEAAGLGPYSLRVVAGYLYSASRGEPMRPTPELRELQLRGAALEADLERTLAHAGTPTVAEAIERYLAFYAIWARELSPLVAAARAALPTELRRLGHMRADALAAQMIGSRESAVEAILLAAARDELSEDDVERTLGCLAPAWDVAVPTFAERPGLLRDAIARATRIASGLLVTRTPPAASVLAGELADEIQLARTAAALAERDDILFARAQHLVRRALLARSAALGIASDDVFWLPLDEIASAARLDPIDARRRAAGARAAAERAMRWQMPLVVGDDSAGAAASMGGAALRGVGTGPRVAGRVVRFATLASAVAVGAGDIVVARAITPALAVLVAGCAAIVSETGGLLDHGAALARELGIPCVVGCKDAWSMLTDGMLVTVDGNAGTVHESGPAT